MILSYLRTSFRNLLLSWKNHWHRRLTSCPRLRIASFVQLLRGLEGRKRAVQKGNNDVI